MMDKTVMLPSLPPLPRPYGEIVSWKYFINFDETHLFFHQNSPFSVLNLRIHYGAKFEHNRHLRWRENLSNELEGDNKMIVAKDKSQAGRCRG